MKTDSDAIGEEYLQAAEVRQRERLMVVGERLDPRDPQRHRMS
jgi:hypothetical protein